MPCKFFRNLDSGDKRVVDVVVVVEGRMQAGR